MIIKLSDYGCIQNQDDRKEILDSFWIIDNVSALNVRRVSRYIENQDDDLRKYLMEFDIHNIRSNYDSKQSVTFTEVDAIKRDGEKTFIEEGTVFYKRLVKIITDKTLYLCNDKGQTIERINP